jgi:hypothetical protein
MLTPVRRRRVPTREVGQGYVYYCRMPWSANFYDLLVCSNTHAAHMQHNPLGMVSLADSDGAPVMMTTQRA